MKDLELGHAWNVVFNNLKDFPDSDLSVLRGSIHKELEHRRETDAPVHVERRTLSWADPNLRLRLMALNFPDEKIEWILMQPRSELLIFTRPDMFGQSLSLRIATEEVSNG